MSIDISTDWTTITNKIVTGNLVIQEGVQDTLIEDVTIQDGSVGLYLSAAAGDPLIERLTVRNLKVQRMNRSAVNLRNFSDVVLEGGEISNVQRDPGSVLHMNCIRTFAGGKNLIVRDYYIHDCAAIGFFTKDGPVDGVLLERVKFERIRDFDTVKCYRTKRMSMRNCDLGGASAKFSEGCEVYIDDATRATGRVFDLDGTTKFLTEDPWQEEGVDPLVQIQAILNSSLTPLQKLDKIREIVNV